MVGWHGTKLLPLGLLLLVLVRGIPSLRFLDLLRLGQGTCIDRCCKQLRVCSLQLLHYLLLINHSLHVLNRRITGHILRLQIHEGVLLWVLPDIVELWCNLRAIVGNCSVVRHLAHVWGLQLLLVSLLGKCLKLCTC